MSPLHANTSRVIAVLSFLVFSAGSAVAEEKFKAASIKGDYGFTCTGTVYGNPFAGIGQLYCVPSVRPRSVASIKPEAFHRG